MQEYMEKIKEAASNFEKESVSLANEVKEKVIKELNKEILDRIKAYETTSLVEDAIMEAVDEIEDKHLRLEVVSITIRRIDVEQLGDDTRSMIDKVDIHMKLNGV